MAGRLNKFRYDLRGIGLWMLSEIQSICHLACHLDGRLVGHAYYPQDNLRKDSYLSEIRLGDCCLRTSRWMQTSKARREPLQNIVAPARGKKFPEAWVVRPAGMTPHKKTGNFRKDVLNWAHFPRSPDEGTGLCERKMAGRGPLVPGKGSCAAKLSRPPVILGRDTKGIQTWQAKDQ